VDPKLSTHPRRSGRVLRWPAQISVPSVEVSPDLWADIQPKVMAYLLALGMGDKTLRSAFAKEIQVRLPGRIRASFPTDPTELAIDEAQQLLDDWLARELGEGQRPCESGLLAARAALLSRASKDWVAAWGNSRPGHIGEILCANIITNVPPQAQLAMPVQPIRLRSLRLLRALFRMLASRIRSGSPKFS